MGKLISWQILAQPMAMLRALAFLLSLELAHGRTKLAKMQTCMDLIFSTQGGGGGSMHKKITKKIGSSSSNSMSKEQRNSVATEVSTSIDIGFIFDSMSIDASLKAAWESAMSSTFSESQADEVDYEFEVTLDLSKPNYWYRTTITIYTADGNSVSLKGNTQMVLNHAAPSPCIDVDVETIKVTGYTGMANMFYSAGHYIRDAVPQDSSLLYAEKVQIGKRECDKDPSCHSFTVATWNGEKDGHNVCLSTGGTMDYEHSQNWDAYVKTSTTQLKLRVGTNTTHDNMEVIV